MNHILVGPWNQRAWAAIDKSGAWPWVYCMGHGCTLVLGRADLSDEQDSTILLAHGQHGMVSVRQLAVLRIERLTSAASALSEFDLCALLKSCSSCDYMLPCHLSHLHHQLVM